MLAIPDAGERAKQILHHIVGDMKMTQPFWNTI